MPNFDLSSYETVKERKVKFYEKYPDGRIIVLNITPTEKLMEFSLFRVELFKNPEEQEKSLVLSTGYAMEIRDTELKIAKSGAKYEDVNYSSWTENCEESAVGRALDNAGFSNKKCSKEEIEKAGRMSKTISNNSLPVIKEEETFKTCPVCGKSHEGQYPKCIECWKKENKK